jgi:hypothetical protein
LSARPFLKPRSKRGALKVAMPRHPYAGKIVGLATIHAKERAIEAPFRRLLGARIEVAPGVDTDVLGTFSGEIARPASQVEVTDMKARMTFAAMDVDCSVASEGSYGPIFKTPLKPAGVEILTFVDRKLGTRIIQTLSTHRTNWRMLYFRSGEEERVVRELKELGFPGFGVFAMQNDDWLTVAKNLGTIDQVIAAVNRQAEASADGLCLVIPDMRAHRNLLRMKVIRATAWKLARQLAVLCPKCEAPGFGHIHSRRGLRCEGCKQPTHWIQNEIDGCSACGHAVARPRKDGRKFASKLTCPTCRPR